MDKFVGEKSLAFEMRGNRLKVLLEDAVPSVTVSGKTYFVTEAPSIVVEGKKYFVDEVV